MNKSVLFKSKWFEKCIRDYLNIGESEPIEEQMLAPIKYLYVSTTHDYELAFGRYTLPTQFEFNNIGDEWECACISNTGRFKSIDEFITIQNWGNNFVLSLNEEVLSEEVNQDEYIDVEGMRQFEESIKSYRAEEEDYEGLEEEEGSFDLGMLVVDDFKYFKNLEVLRLMSCELEIHSLNFLEALKNLKVLEIGEVRLHELSGLDRLIGLYKLCIWSN